MNRNTIQSIVNKYDIDNLTIGVLGGHSALDVCAGAKRHGLKTIAVCQKGREKTYNKYYRTRDALNRVGEVIGCVDDVLVVEKFGDVVNPEVQAELLKRNTVFIHNRYFWVYCDFNEIEKKFAVPIFGSRTMLRLEERSESFNQYHLLEKAGIRMPKLFKTPKDIDRLCVVKVNEAERGYERAFFTVASFEAYQKKADELIKRGTINEKDLKNATIEEYIIGAHINLNFFYSPLAKEIELLGTDMRRQTNLDGLIRMPAWEQVALQNDLRPRTKLIETGHVAVTMKESLIEKAIELGERFVAASQKESPPGIIGPFALQGAVVAEEGKEDFVIFDVSMRIPGSPGTRFTPYTGYLYPGDYGNMSCGERVALEILEGVKQGKLQELVT